MTKVFALHLFGCMEIFVLILMAVDRYVAICKPLRYPVIMSRQVCAILIILAWIGSFYTFHCSDCSDLETALLWAQSD